MGRQQSKLKVHVRNAVIGGPRPLICLPLVAKTSTMVVQEAETLVALQPDLFEWRADAFDRSDNREDCLSLLDKLRTTIGLIPLLFTCRIDLEGGLSVLSRESRLELIVAAIESGDIDIVDVELCNSQEFIQSVKECARANNVKVILSYHNFIETPDEQFICAKLLEAQTAGADISKLAVMPKNYQDVLTLLSATNKARNEAVDIPIVTMSMGAEGAVSRIAGGLFGSDITFAIGMQASAPGQIPIDELRKAMALLYNQ